MSAWNPVWRIKINGVAYTTTTLSDLRIQSGRRNIYEQAYAGYCTINLINYSDTIVPISINDAVTIEVQDNAAAYVALFGGTVVDLGIEVRDIGNTYTQTVTITAVGALARLPKALTDGVLSEALDGEQILTILQDLLLNNWSEVAAATTWATYEAGVTWATAENVGLGEIDAGNYSLAARTSDVTDIYSLCAALANSGLGYLYEDPQGRISYADSTHRSTYLATYGYTELSANDALGAGLKIQTRAGDVRNDLTLKYGAASNFEVTDEDLTSIGLYGRLAQVITTTLKHSADAVDQAAFYLTIRSAPNANFEQITYELTNPEITSDDRDSLLNVFMGLPVIISDMPTNMGATFLGFVEGWQFQAAFNRLSLTATLSPLAYSLQAMAWADVSVSEAWNTISGSLEWQDALVVN